MENAVGALYVRETFAGESKQMVSSHAFGEPVCVYHSSRELFSVISRTQATFAQGIILTFVCKMNL